LPDTRQSITHKFNVGGHEGYINVGLYPDGRPGELFITMAKEGSTIGGLMDAFGTAISMSLQYGVPLEVLVNKFSHTRFEPMGYTTNQEIRLAKSVVDYIFRWMGITFLAGYREAQHTAPDPDTKDAAEGKKTDSSRSADAKSEGSAAARPSTSNGTGGKATGSSGSPANGTASNGSPANGPGSARAESASRPSFDAGLLQRAGAAMHLTREGGPASLSDQFAQFQSDAPSCDNCGAITVRNGNCYLCYNCGNSMGCS
jgi:ribonucleoside-diphosphate reductase alpha chain